jgi:hypothetical protein
MEINRKNYEAYFLDYRENSLSAEQVAELMIFLEENPDLKSEFDSFESFVLEPKMEISFSKKESLKKTTIISTENINSDNIDELLVANLEGDISEKEREELTAFMGLNPKVKLESNIYRSTLLMPDLSITYSDRESLKKGGVFLLYRTQMIYGLSIAATIIILLGVYFGFLNRPLEETDEIRYSNLTRVEIIEPGIKIEKPIIAEIPQKNNVSSKVPIIHNNPETLKNNPKVLTLAEMDVYGIKTIDVSGEGLAYGQTIKLRQSASDEFILASIDDPVVVEDQKPNKSFFKRFIAGMTNKLIDVEKPKSKSFLEYTIDGYNFMADRDVEVDKELDENGKVVAYKVNGENISLGRRSKNGTAE